MATIYWNFSSSAWTSTATSFTDSTKLAYWTAGTSDTNNQALLSYRVLYDTTAKKMYLEFKIRSKNKTIDTERTGQLCSSSNFTGTFGLYIKQGSTNIFSYVPANFASASTSTTTIAKLPTLKQSTSWQYNGASTDGTTITVPWKIDVTSYAGKALTVNLRLAWGRVYTISGVKYFEDANMTSLGDKSLCTLPAGTYTVAYNQNGHGTKPASQTKYPGVTLGLRGAITDSSPTSVTITGNANGGTWSGSNGSATYIFVQTKWNTNSSGTGTDYALSANYTANAALTLYAVWGSKSGQSYTLPTGTPTKAASTTSSMTVTFNANGGSTTKSSQVSSKPVTYSFKGWFTAASGGTQRTTASRVTAAETVYAQYDSTIGSQSAVTLPTTSQCTRDGYQLLGFSTSDTATTATYQPGASYTPTAAITLYAVWQLTQSVFSKVYINGVWKDATPYVYANGAWRQATPNIRVGNVWKN